MKITETDSRNAAFAAFRMRVLVIEDNHDLARLFCDLLEVMGCATEVAFNARTGIASARRTTPDLVFCDLRLPGEKDGFDVARDLHSDGALGQIPLIALTACSDDEEQRRAREAGFERVLVKPIKFAELQDVLKDYQKS